MSLSIPERTKISYFFVFFLISSMQIGIGVLGFQRIIAKSAGYDAWISVLFAGLSIHIVIWVMYKLLETVNGDLVSAHIYVLGKKLGKLVSLFFAFYFLTLSIAVLRTFIEIIQVWMFPDINIFWFSFVFLLLIVYCNFGGFRTIAGIAFFGTVLPSYLTLMFGFALPFSNFENLLPIFDHKITELLSASFDMSLTYLGYETLLLFYPYIKSPEKSKKWAHLAILSTTLVYTILTILTFGFFSEGQLEHTVWASLSMWKIVQLPFVERFEYIGIANWNLVILPNLCIAIWGASRILKRTVHLKQKYGVLMISTLCLVGVNLFESRSQINMLNDMTGRIGFYFNYIYLPFLLAAILVVKKVKKK
jgi:spore germination protein AB